MTRTVARLGIWLRAGAALILILTLVAGVPWLLVATVGNPVPTDGWSWSQPLSNDAMLAVIAVLAWLFWAQMVLCLIVETAAEVRLAVGRSAEWMTRIPGTLTGQQQLARVLVHAVIAVGISAAFAAAPALTSTGTVSVASAEPLDHSTPASPRPPAATPTGDERPTPPPDAALPVQTESKGQAGGQRAHSLVEVARGDTLWSIAEKHLGSGEQWRRIADLNQGRPMPDGHRFIHASSLQPGWQLLVPTDDPSHTGDQRDRAEQVVVSPDDTLWDIAEDAYGDGTDWPRIYQANTDQIDDPDLIHPGQTLEVPGSGDRTDHHTASPAPRVNAEPPATAHGRVPPPRVLPTPTATPTHAPAPPTTRTEGAPSQAQPAPGAPRADSSGSAEDGTLAVALTAGGSLLAGGSLVLLMARRRRQFRRRRSGRAIAPTANSLVAAETAVRSTGSSGGASAAFLDRALRDLSARLAELGDQLPDVAAVRFSIDRLDLLLTTPSASSPPPEPWQIAEDGNRWTLPRDALPAQGKGEPDPLAPYPALVAVGTAEDGATWLLDLEAAGLVQLLGDRTACEDLARFMAAELAVNVWSDDVDVTVAGFAPEVVGLNPARIRYRGEADISLLAKKVRRVHEASLSTEGGVLAGRLNGRGADSWMPTILVTCAHPGSHLLREDVERLLEDLNAHPGRNAAALVTAHAEAPLAGGTGITVDQDRRCTLMPWNVTLSVNQLTAHDAQTLADLIAGGEDEGDVPMPAASGGQPLHHVCDAAGGLRADLTERRDPETSPGSLLPLSDEQYLATATTTPADLAALAPNVSNEARERVLALDPTLDADLADWSDPNAPRPRLCLLGPVELRASGERTADVDRRCAYFTEIVAYLASQTHGATPDQVADTFHVQPNTIHSRIGTIRKWLGTDPSTGKPYLPESTLSPSAKRRGVSVYEIVGLLSDVDLFTRLRVRAQARGHDGIDDLTAALRLVAGRPFDQLRTGGYGWLAATPLDQYLTAGIVDVAHIVATHALSTENIELARWASEVAITAAPSEDKPRLDYAASLTASGHTDEANSYLTAEVHNRTDDHGPPPPPTGRTREVLDARTQIRSQWETPHAP